jgi:hypothetical protein
MCTAKTNHIILKHAKSSTKYISVVKMVLCNFSLRISLFHEAKEVRAATLRVLRYFIQDGETIDLVCLIGYVL